MVYHEAESSGLGWAMAADQCRMSVQQVQETVGEVRDFMAQAGDAWYLRASGEGVATAALRVCYARLTYLYETLMSAFICSQEQGQLQETTRNGVTTRRKLKTQGDLRYLTAATKIATEQAKIGERLGDLYRKHPHLVPQPAEFVAEPQVEPEPYVPASHVSTSQRATTPPAQLSPSQCAMPRPTGQAPVSEAFFQDALQEALGKSEPPASVFARESEQAPPESFASRAASAGGEIDYDAIVGAMQKRKQEKTDPLRAKNDGRPKKPR
jgi:hypothetical protein